MNKEKRRVPKLRFPGFTEDWEQRKLSDITDVIMGQSPSSKNYTDNPNDNILVQGNADLKDGKVIPRLWTKEITKTIDKDGIILTVRAPVGDVAKTDYKVVLGRGVAGIKGNDFIYQFLQKLQYNRHWVSLSSGSTFESINSNDIKDLIIDIPSIEEQNKISMLLNNVNSIITLHQRKLEHLNLKKKALLQKLFPKNGARYPELRFPGFTDAWEQRKLNEFLSVSNFKNIDNKYNKNDVLSVSGDYGIVNQIEFQGRSFAGVSVSNYGLVETGDIVYTKSPLKLNPYGIIKANRINAGIVSTLYAIYKTKKNCDSKFIEHYFNLDSRLNKYLKPLVNKGAKNDMKVSSENALIGEVCFPHVTEQKLIAVFLDRLDLFITLHQRKLEHLQLQKKALLQQMFV